MYQDVLPIDLASGPPRMLVYRVRTLNAAGRGLQPIRVDAPAGEAPLPMRDLTAERIAAGIALHWAPDPRAAEDRIELQVVRGGIVTPATKRAAQTPRRSLLVVEPSPRDAGGAVDTGAQPGVAQVYSVQRVRTVHLGVQTFALSSLPATATVSADAHPRPLAPPTGLEGVPSTIGGTQVALVWEPVEGAAGYRVFRAAGPDQPVPLTGNLVDGFSFTDTAVERGKAYHYSVATVDRYGQAGPRSGEVQVSIPAE